jgi:hypothetical protein
MTWTFLNSLVNKRPIRQPHLIEAFLENLEIRGCQRPNHHRVILFLFSGTSFEVAAWFVTFTART